MIMKYTYYEILEGDDKGIIIRVNKALGEILVNGKWEPYNDLDILFGEIDSKKLSEEEVIAINR